MMVLVCGSRAWRASGRIEEVLEDLPRGTLIVHGGCRGADRMADTAAGKLGFRITEIPADWKNLGRSAGYRRNIAMLDLGPDLVIAFWRSGSTGTAHTIREARKRGIPVDVHYE